jgi:hypothetical protein
MKNRFVEAVPALTDRPVSAIARPAMKKFAEAGTGPGRFVYSAPGAFNEDLFFVSGLFLYRVSSEDASVRSLGQISNNVLGDVSMCAIAAIGTVPTRLFIAEGGVLWFYTENGEALGHLEVTTSIANGDQVRIDDIYYEFTTGSVDAGTPDGSSGNPWLVFDTGLSPASLENLFNAINDTGTAGTDYSSGLEAHPTVRGTALSSADMYVNAKQYGTDGNSIVTTETGAGLEWEAGTLTGGGDEQLRQARMPNGVGAVSIAAINSYVIVVPVQDEALETVGRYYWINPGENYADDLDFANAERSQDKIHQVRVFGDKFWLLGQITTEPWITTGTPAAPMQRFQGILFDRGSWEGTAVQVKDSLIVCDEDGGVFQIAGGQRRISRPDIEERIRRAMELEAFSGVGL